MKTSKQRVARQVALHLAMDASTRMAGDPPMSIKSSGTPSGSGLSSEASANPMNRFWPFHRAPKHVTPRYHAATKAENRAASAKSVEVQCQLAVYVATTSAAQRRADARGMR